MSRGLRFAVGNAFRLGGHLEALGGYPAMAAPGRRSGTRRIELMPITRLVEVEGERIIGYNAQRVPAASREIAVAKKTALAVTERQMPGRGAMRRFKLPIRSPEAAAMVASAIATSASTAITSASAAGSSSGRSIGRINSPSRTSRPNERRDGRLRRRHSKSRPLDRQQP